MSDPSAIRPDPAHRPDRWRPIPVDRADGGLPDLEPSPEPAAQADRRNVQGKLAAGWRGLKLAVRGDSSFFAHFYRGTLIVIAAAMLGLDVRGWCLLTLCACLVLLSEVTHSAVDTLARAVGDPEEFRLKAARDIAAAGVLVTAIGTAAVTLTLLAARLADFLGWNF